MEPIVNSYVEKVMDEVYAYDLHNDKNQFLVNISKLLRRYGFEFYHEVIDFRKIGGYQHVPRDEKDPYW